MTVVCGNCDGRGTRSFDGQTSACPLCKGSGWLPSVYRFRLTNEETGVHLDVTFDATRARATSDGRYVEVGPVFDAACARIAVSQETHFLYVRNHPIEFIAYMHDPYMQPDLTAASAMATHFVWYWRERTADEVIDLRFKRRVSTERLLDELLQKMAPRGFTYALVVSEGNIATGERGWDVVLMSRDGKRGYESLGLAYELAVALRQALDRVGAVLQRTVP